MTDIGLRLIAGQNGSVQQLHDCESHTVASRTTNRRANRVDSSGLRHAGHYCCRNGRELDIIGRAATSTNAPYVRLSLPHCARSGRRQCPLRQRVQDMDQTGTWLHLCIYTHLLPASHLTPSRNSCIPYRWISYDIKDKCFKTTVVHRPTRVKGDVTDQKQQKITKGGMQHLASGNVLCE